RKQTRRRTRQRSVCGIAIPTVGFSEVNPYGSASMRPQSPPQADFFVCCREWQLADKFPQANKKANAAAFGLWYCNTDRRVQRS
ncbi:MAG: hypothetical protein ACKO9S_09225, partial [Bacteroidota bacterium]